MIPEGYHGHKAISFQVLGKPVPWSTPDVGVGLSKHGKRIRYHKKNPALINWQKDVAVVARVAYGPREPWEGLVHADFLFCLECHDPDLEGIVVVPEYREIMATGKLNKKGNLPDTTNLTKAVEDALEGIIYVNDTQIRSNANRCVWSQNPGVSITIAFIDRAERLTQEQTSTK